MYKSIIFIVVTALLLVSCQDDGQKEGYRIGVSQCSGGFWRDKQNSEMQRELLQHDNITMELLCAYDDDEHQIRDIQHFIDEGVDAIIVSPNSEESLAPIIGKAYDSGIPVILFDRYIKSNSQDSTSQPKYTAFVGGDNIGVGVALGSFMATHLASGSNVIELMGNMQTSPARLRHEGFLNVMKKHPDIHILTSVDARWDGPKTKEVIDSLFKIYPKVDGIVAHSDFMASSAQHVADSLRPGNKMKFIGADGFGAPDLGIFAVAEGKIDATAIYPTGGDKIMRAAINVLHGQKIKREDLMPSHIVSDSDDAKLLVFLNDEMVNDANNVMQMKKKVDIFGQQLQMERILLLSMIAILLISVIMIVAFLRLYIVKRRTNAQLSRQQEELTRQRDQLLDMTKQLEKATNAKLVFFTNISHDFRTPLTLISAPLESAYSKLKEDKGNMSENKDVLHLINISRRNVQVLLDLVNQILDFRKIENGKMELHPEPVNLLPVLKEWFESFQKLAEQKSIRMELQIEEGDWNVICDQKRLERMVYNLIGNSMKFTPVGGIIRLKGWQKDGNVNIAVQDTGIGIKEEELHHIFERFYQIEKSGNEGTGIGLALVKNLVELMHGKIEVVSNTDSTKGETGTTITMILPLENAVDEKSEEMVVLQGATINPLPILKPAEVDISEDESNPVVLVIDDNDDIRDYLTALLSAKYRVITAVDGANGLEIARRTVPDIILCDVMMPVMNGLECCRRLKTDITTSHIPVLMLTACSLDEQQVQGLSEGAEAYISKPFSSIVLMAQIESLLKNRVIVRNFYGMNQNTEATSTTTIPETTENVNVPDTSKEDKQKTARGLSKYDQEFISKLKFTVNDQLHNVDFGVEALAGVMCLSRAQLYRKCKALLGDSPVELIRNSRMVKAQLLLNTSDMPITEIGKAVGIPDSSYFAKCYKAYFSVLPSSQER